MRPWLVLAVLGVLLSSAAVPGGGVFAQQAPDLCARWRTSYNTPHPDVTDPSDYQRKVLVHPDGSTVYAVGTVDFGTSNSAEDFAVLALDAATGDVLWNAVHDGGADLRDHLADAELSPDGTRLYLVGNRNAPARDALMMAVDTATGALAWRTTWNGGSGADHAHAVATSAEGSHLVVSGTEDAHSITSDGFLLGLDPVTGGILWDLTWDGGAGKEERFQGVAVTSAGLAVTGGFSEDGAGVARGIVLAADEDGVAWVHRTSLQGAYPFVLMSEEGGTTYALSQRGNLSLLVLDTLLGHEQMNATFEGEPSVLASAVLLAPDTLFVAGSRQRTDPVTGTLSTDALALALDLADGRARWVRYHNGHVERTDRGLGVALSPAGTEVYVAGYSDGSGSHPNHTDADFVLLAFDAATGERRWATTLNHVRYNGANDWYGGLAVGQGGRVFVGIQHGPGPFDRMVLAYDPSAPPLGIGFDAPQASPGGHLRSSREVHAWSTSDKLDKFDLFLDGTLLTDFTSTPAPRFTWDTTTVEDGEHELLLRAEDGRGCRAEALRPVRVDNTPPTLQLLRPENGVHLEVVSLPAPEPVPTIATGRVPIDIEARDEYSGLASVEFLVDGRARHAAAAPFLPWWYWYAEDEALGEHVLTVRVHDKAGNLAEVERRVALTLPASDQGILATLEA